MSIKGCFIEIDYQHAKVAYQAGGFGPYFHAVPTDFLSVAMDIKYHEFVS